jgi:hypothetical protein
VLHPIGSYDAVGVLGGVCLGPEVVVVGSDMSGGGARGGREVVSTVVIVW